MDVNRKPATCQQEIDCFICVPSAQLDVYKYIRKDTTEMTFGLAIAFMGILPMVML